MAMDIPYLQNKRRVLVQLAEDIAIDTPHRVYAVVPRSDNLEEGFEEISFQQAVRAYNYLGRWIQSVLGATPDHKFESLTYFGVSDLRYTLLTLACIKCGYKLLLPSPRNSLPVNLSLMEQVESTKVLYSAELKHLAQSLASASSDMQTFQIPSFNDILVGKAEPIAYQPSFEEALGHPVVVLHSSGSTGPPKPITFTNGSIATLGADWEFKAPEGRKIVGLPLFVSNGRECRYFGPMPPFHLGGLYYQTIAPIYSLAVPVYQPAVRLPNPELVLEILHHQDVQAVVLPPSLIEGLLHVPGGLERLKKLDWIMFSGGPLSQSAGDQIRKYTTLTPYYGSTELLAIRQVTPEPDHWSFLEFHPADHFRMDHFDEDVYELVALPDPEAGPGNPGSAAFVHSLPGSDVYYTKDLFKKHPHRDLWQFFGRKDDIIVMSSGEKINPGPFEKELKGEAVIADVLMVGSNRRRPALLVEPKAEHRSDSDLEGHIWGAVQRINAVTSGPSRVSRELIMVTHPDRPFVRTGKGSVVRRLTVATYEHDIDTLYSKAVTGRQTQGCIDAEKCTLGDLRTIVQSTIAEVLTSSPPDDSSNLYLFGLDSLSTADAVSSIANQIGKHPWLIPNLLYTNPSIEQLTSAIFARIKNVSVDDSVNRTAILQDMRARMMTGFAAVDDILEDRSLGHRLELEHSSEISIAVTGTTGSLGSILVETLIRSHAVKEVICLNRSTDAQLQRNKWRAAKRSTSAPESPEAPLTFYTTDFSQPLLGLSEVEIQHVQSCNIIIHNAWRVNFNLNLSSFEDNLIALRNILDLCAQTRWPPKLVFVSSISSASSLSHVPEGAVNDAACAPMGYGESKFVAERMLDQAAAESSRIDATVLRIGQIAGSRHSDGPRWPKIEAFPGIMQTSKSLAMIPADLPAVDWIPIDEITECIFELSIANQAEKGKVTYYNVSNPHHTEWQTLIQPLREYCGLEAKTGTMREWVDALAQFDDVDKQQLARLPALKIMTFLSHLADDRTRIGQTIDTKQAISHSASLAALEPIDQASMREWLVHL